jgi:hypothetical protein
MEHGRLSRASDVYGYGILLFELMTGQAAFKGVPRAVLGYDVMKMHRRPGGCEFLGVYECSSHCTWA